MSDYRDESRTRWAATARGWEAGAAEFNRAAMPVSTWMVDAIQPQPGHQVLELGAGTGDTGLLAAELVQPGGTVTLSDFVPEMLSAAQRLAESRGLENVRFRQIDAELPLDLEAASLDGVLWRWGYHLLTGADDALRETRRVLRPGGRVALAAWTGPEDNPWSALPVRALVERGLMQAGDPSAPGQFAWATEDTVHRHLEDAGFVEHAVEPVSFALRLPSVEAWWESQVARSMRTADAGRRLDPATRAAVLDELAEAAAPWRAPDGSLALPSRSWVAWAEA
jgi:ubiquinone/menaquinone biosynthesis C-methylase UbiE